MKIDENLEILEVDARVSQKALERRGRHGRLSRVVLGAKEPRCRYLQTLGRYLSYIPKVPRGTHHGSNDTAPTLHDDDSS